MDRLVPSFNVPRTAAGQRDAAPGSDRAKVTQLAQEFEAMLMLQMVRQMRQSLLEQGEEQKGLGADTMIDTFDLEFARYLAQSGGMGLASLLASHVPLESSSTATTGDSTMAPSGDTTTGATPAIERDLTRVNATTHVEAATSALPAGLSGSGTLAASPAPPASVSSGGVVLPLDSAVSSRFGWRTDPFLGTSRFHGGMDLKAAYGREVPTAAPGRVVFAGERGNYGQLVEVEHENGLRTRYAHLSSITVSAGEQLAHGAVVGRVGSSGRSTGPHLHFEVWKDGVRVDPAEMARASLAD